MNCEQVKEGIPDLLVEALDADSVVELNRHLAACEVCRTEVERLRGLWNLLAQLPPESPRELLASRFYGMLDAVALNRESLPGSAPGAGRQAFLGAGLFGSGGWLPQAAMAAVLIALGLLLGQYWSGRQPANGEMDRLRQEIQDMNRLVTLSLLQQQSASDRLSGLNWSYRINQPDDRVIDALLEVLKTDRDVNVRLATIDALEAYAGQPRVREAFVEVLPDQMSPLVQIALIDELVRIREKGAVQVLRRLSGDEQASPEVRKRAQWGLQQLG